MVKILAAALAIAGTVIFTAPMAANAAPRADGIANTTQTDLSAARKHVRKTARRVVRRHYRAVRTYRAPAYYGYYGPTYYDRPYYRPAPLGFGIGGWW